MTTRKRYLAMDIIFNLFYKYPSFQKCRCKQGKLKQTCAWTVWQPVFLPTLDTPPRMIANTQCIRSGLNHISARDTDEQITWNFTVPFHYNLPISRYPKVRFSGSYNVKVITTL
ncbi:hypothetical protein VN97_g110 [Penicillium thymicola]|uniref:Uncharacterized protein n=1 Tax=Penicillium thymicola TaxID=293382 RepID=A0AAI9XDJ8_PENTH|nr:hypothetical protein VN97_g110 [Penicillium thymicola]